MNSPSSSPVVIPDQLKGRGLRFTRLRPPILGDKNSGKGPIDPDYYDDGALAEDAPSLLAHLESGLGFGLVGTFGDFIGFDADEGEELAALGIMARLPPTLTDKAPNKPESLHLYYVCPGLPKTFHFYHPTKTVEKDGEGGEVKQLVRLELGQICAGRGHITGPGAPHWSGGRREIIDDSPLAEITVDDLRAILRGLAFSDDPTKNPTFETAAGLEEKAGRWDALEEITRKARRGRRGDGPSLSERIGDIRRVLDTYGWSPTTKSGDEWKGDVPGEYSKSKTALAVDIKKGVWYCHHHADSGGDAAALVALFEGLIDCRGKDHLRDPVVFQAVIKACEEKGLIPTDEDRGRGEISTAEARDYLETVRDGLKADPRKLKDRAVLAALLTLRENDPIEFDILAEELPTKRRTLDKALNLEKTRLEKARAEEVTGDGENWLTSDILEKAKAIMREGDPLQYLIYQAQRSHVGDINYQKVVLLSVAASNSLTSQGIHPGGTGDKGSGKTDAMKAVFHLLPPAPWKKSGSLSSLAAFYMDLPPGTIFYSDDVVWDLIGPIFRQATGSYQDGAVHNTISKDREYRPLSTPPRLTWWLTSVEATHKEQENDRQYPISTDPSDSHKKIVSKEIAKRRARKERRREVDEGLLVARAIIWLIKSHDPFQVLIPQAENAEWILFRDFRGQERFWDTVEAFAILRFMQRETDSDGWLIASDEDIDEARALFKADNLAHATKLTKAETALLGVMLDGGEYSQAGLSKALGIAQQTVSERLNAIMGRTKYITSDKGPNGKILYSINAKEEIDPSLWDNFEMVKIRGRKKPEAGELTGGLQVGYSPLTGIPTGLIINISKYIPVSLQVKREGECEEKFPVEGGGNEAQKSDEKIISPTGRVKRPVNSENQQQAMVVGGCNHTCNPPVTVPVTDPVEQKPATGGGCSDPVKEPVDSERGDDYQSIAENLEEDRRRQAEEAERTKTPPPKGDEGRAPTSEEAVVLEDLAGRILENWPGLPEMLLWETTRDRLGRPISIATVRLWLAAEGYILSSERLNGSPLWNPPVGVIS